MSLRRLASKALKMMPGGINKSVRKLLGSKVVYQDGLKWYVTYDTRYGYAVSRDKYEHNLHHYFFDYCPPNCTFLDIGAGAGKYSLLLAKSGAKVFAWEPNPFNRSVLETNLRLNNLEATVYEDALGAEEKQGRLVLRALASKVSDKGEQAVSIRTLDSYAFKRVDLVKIDVEGYEHEVLRGAKNTLETCRPVLFLELHPHLVANTRELCLSFLSSFGYTYKDVGMTKGGNSEYVLAIPPERRKKDDQVSGSHPNHGRGVDVILGDPPPQAPSRTR